jgi:hypothetical protein
MCPLRGLSWAGVQVNFHALQRLFFMFPAGAAGCGLLILRCCAAGMLLRLALPQAATALPFWGAGGVILLAVLLFLGAFTPVGCFASGVALIATLVAGIDQRVVDVTYSLAVTLALFLIGPGAFSVDGRLFGRRLIRPSSSIHTRTH